MIESPSEPKFYEAEYIAQAVENILSNPFAYLRNLNDFYENGIVAPNDGRTVLHLFIEYVTDGIIRDEAHNINSDRTEGTAFSDTGKILNNDYITPIEEAFNFYDIEHDSFEDWLQQIGKDSLFGVDEDDISDYLDELFLTGELDKLYKKISEDVFLILSKKPQLTATLDEMVADYLIDDFNNEE